ncbi:hypothetical protein [Sphingomonas radiodurans]|uniref:hypothetical protein n=1 Tax=Sphingomonas radiodurans TaxID=2890321 RepID=UPI001E5B91E2|nr:hypothetical protein [Sphingomonas radiodurans]WBH17033.1 hypothetical protein LLW23_02625 [Sphingomonas radiodurans]
MKVSNPHARLEELAKARRVSLTEVARVIRRPARYVHRFVREGFPLELRPDERKTLSQFFGVAEIELGGEDPRWAKFKVVK